MRFWLSILFIMIAGLGFSRCGGEEKEKEYSLVWSDEFDGAAVDTAKWSVETGGGGWGNAELEYYQAANATVSGGYLNITAKKESVGGSSYTSARMKTQGIYSFQYGKITARIKLPVAAGLWPAFWMLGTTTNSPISQYWPSCGEIDIMESKGANTIYSTCHWGDGSGDTHVEYGTTTTTTADQFHEYEVEWTETKVTACIDGVQFYVIDISPAGLSEFHQNFYILLNMAVGGNFVGGTIPADANLPATMQVDYIRVYQYQ